MIDVPDDVGDGDGDGTDVGQAVAVFDGIGEGVDALETRRGIVGEAAVVGDVDVSAVGAGRVGEDDGQAVVEGGVRGGIVGIDVVGKEAVRGRNGDAGVAYSIVGVAGGHGGRAQGAVDEVRVEVDGVAQGDTQGVGDTLIGDDDGVGNGFARFGTGAGKLVFFSEGDDRR